MLGMRWAGTFTRGGTIMQNMRALSISTALAGMAVLPGLLVGQQDLKVGGGVAVQALPAVGVPGFEVTPIVQAMLSYGIFEQVELGTVVGFAPMSVGGQASGMTFQSIQLEPRFVPFKNKLIQPFVGGRVGYVRRDLGLPVEGRKMAAGGFALGAVGGAAFKASQTVSLEFGGTFTSVYYGSAAQGTYSGKGTGLGLFFGTSIQLGVGR